METRVALIGIIVEDLNQAAKMNEILHQYAPYVLGRMGIPHRERGVSILSVVVEAPADVINSVSGKLGMLPGIQTKTIYSRIGGQENEKGNRNS